MRSLFTVFALALVAKVGVAATPVSLDCTTAPGGYLCRQMQSIQSLMDTSCSGTPCHSLFRQQAAAYQSFVEYYNQNVFEPPTVDATMAAQAWKVANTVCNYQWSGDSSIFSGTIFQGNLLLDVLKEVQTGAGEKLTTGVRYCRLSIY